MNVLKGNSSDFRIENGLAIDYAHQISPVTDFYKIFH